LHMLRLEWGKQMRSFPQRFPMRLSTTKQCSSSLPRFPSTGLHWMCLCVFSLLKKYVSCIRRCAIAQPLAGWYAMRFNFVQAQAASGRNAAPCAYSAVKRRLCDRHSPLSRTAARRSRRRGSRRPRGFRCRTNSRPPGGIGSFHRRCA